MKATYLIPTLLVTLLMVSCAKISEYTIDFCTQMDAHQECDPSANEFEVGDNVYVLFESNLPFPQEYLVGKFYAVEPSGKLLLGEQKWELGLGDNFAYDTVLFREKGTYLFEFSDENGTVLATNELIVK